MTPGMKKVAGETLCDMLMPLHPAPISNKTDGNASQRSCRTGNFMCQPV